MQEAGIRHKGMSIISYVVVGVVTAVFNVLQGQVALWLIVKIS